MNPIKCVAYKVKVRINRILKNNKSRRSVETEQEERHREFETYMKRYLECVEKSRAEEE